jgi:formate-dependent phosphoribosylglycinamide formyltransferase (GAR transformylase)
MDVVMISPGYPVEMAEFARGLATVGARVIGIGDQSADALPATARDALAHHIHVHSLTDETAVLRAVHELAPHVDIRRVECLWEPHMVLAARIRESLGLPGMTVEQTIPFRDKEQMKRRLDAAGIRTPWHETTTTAAGVRDIAGRIGYPIIVKPIAGAGSADTYRVDSADQLEQVLPRLRHVPEVSVEEFVDAEEFTYDTICAGGRILHDSIAWYRPRPLVMRQNEWVSPVSVVLRDLDRPELAVGRAMGARVLEALGFRDGFTHMEWYRKADGEVVFGEIGARPPGARVVDLMNYSCDADFFVGWAEAVVHGRLTQPTERRYNAASIFKRARGQGRITAIDGLSRLLAEHGEHVAVVDLAQPGTPRSDWTQSVIADGRIVVRHPDLSATLEIADRFASELHLHAS